MFEITETAVINLNKQVIDTLNALKSNGFMLALDDFGTGYSSLSYLQKLPVDTLKIDRCFVMQLNQCIKNDALMKAIMAIADAFNLGVVAEGVETLEQLEALKKMKCNKVQGFYFGKAEPPTVIENQLFNRPDSKT